MIEYGVPDVRPSAAPWIRIVVFNRFNQIQATLIDNGAQEAGNFKVTWYAGGPNGFPVPSGVYYVELDQVNFSGSSLNTDVTTLLRITALKQ